MKAKMLLTSYMKKNIDCRGQNCYITTSVLCFIKCINYVIEKDYTEEIREFIKSEKNRSGVMTSARIQQFCRKYNINIGCFDGTRRSPRIITESNTSSFIYNDNF